MPNASDEEFTKKLVPYLRYGHSVVNCNGLVYLWGGRNDNYGACREVFCYDTSEYKCKWDAIATMYTSSPNLLGHRRVVSSK